MSRVILIHWNATEAEERAEYLRRAGWKVDFPTGQGAAAFRAIRDDPPDAFAIDLTRIPSQGQAAATMLRQQKATRLVPIVFVAGDPEKVARARKYLPDAVYAQWDRICDALQRAIKHPPRDPLVPGTMDAYSGTPLPKKLGIQAGLVVALLGALAGFERKLGAVRKDIRIKTQARGSADVILLFTKTRADLDHRLPAATRAMTKGGSLWIAWPKKASGVATDLTQREVQTLGLGAGLIDYKIAAIDEIWSGLRFARRRSRSRRRH